MRDDLARIFVMSAGISLAIYLLLIVVHFFGPGLFRTPIEWWLLPLLFAVGFVPRAGTLLMHRYWPKRRRRSRKT